MAKVTIDVAKEQSVTNVNTAVANVKTVVDTINTSTDKIGNTTDADGSATAGSMFAKFNKLINDVASFMANWTATRAAKLDNIDTINTNVNTIKTNTSAGQNVVYTNIFSGILDDGQGITVTGKGRITMMGGGTNGANVSIKIDTQSATTSTIPYGASLEMFFNETAVIDNASSSSGPIYYVAQTM